MRRFTIEIRTREEAEAECQSRLDVVDDEGKRCDGLDLGEVLAQIVSLCHPKLGEPQFAMHTPEEWQRRRDQQQSHFAELNQQRAEARQLMLDALCQWRQAEQTDDPAEFANAQRARDEAIAKATAT